MAESKHGLLSFFDKVNPAKLQEIARKELGETEETKEKCLQEIRTLITENKVACICTDDFLLRFMRRKKFQTKKSFEMFRNYLHFKTYLHRNLLVLRPELLETLIRRNILGVLPYRDAAGRQIGFFRAGVWNPDVCTMDELFTMYFLYSSYITEDESSQIIGVVLLYDLRSVNVSFFFHMMRLVNIWRNFSFNCVPMRLANIHILSDSVLLKYVHNIIFPFIPKKIADQVMFHEEPAGTLFEHIPDCSLPETVGGIFGAVDAEHIIKTMKDYVQKLKDEYHYFQQNS